LLTWAYLSKLLEMDTSPTYGVKVVSRHDSEHVIMLILKLVYAWCNRCILL